jgi:hypothetical protein
LTLLSAATLDDFLPAYNMETFQFNTDGITEKINEFKLSKTYSDIFKGLVCNLCEFDENKRITAEQLWNWIGPHEQKIRDRENFYIPSAPNKIHQAVQEVRQTIQQVYGAANKKPSYTEPKLNFPPPIIRSNVAEGYHPSPHLGYGIRNNPGLVPAESVYVPLASMGINQASEGGAYAPSGYYGSYPATAPLSKGSSASM